MLTADSTGLIVVDVQGKLAQSVIYSELLHQKIRALIQGAKILKLPILWLEQMPEKLGATSEELASELKGYPHITKSTFDACSNQDFLVELTEAHRRSWLVCGVESHICVYQTVASLLHHHYRVEIVTDGISSRTLENYTLGIDKMRRMGAELTSVEMCLYEMVKDASVPEFKSILSLIR